MHSTAKLLAGAAGLTTAFVAGGYAKDKYNQVTISSDYYGGRDFSFDFNKCDQAKFEKAVPILPRESLAELAKNKVFFLTRIKNFNEIKS